LLAIGAAVPCLTAIGSPASAACGTRHFYNHSDFDWTITMEGGATCSIGSANKTTKCTVGAGQTAELHYPDNPATVSLKSPVFDGSFRTDSGQHSCFIDHGNRPTGNSVLNDPAEGDIQTCGRRTGGNYPCSK
jgi:hypothetical protein